MTDASKEKIENLKKIWTDRHVVLAENPREELKRFAGKVGRVITVNWSGRAVVDFADGAWYDVANFESVLTVIDDAERIKSFDATANSAQAKPGRQG